MKNHHPQIWFENECFETIQSINTNYLVEQLVMFFRAHGFSWRQNSAPKLNIDQNS